MGYSCRTFSEEPLARSCVFSSGALLASNKPRRVPEAPPFTL
jgi:hypothetical protein